MNINSTGIKSMDCLTNVIITNGDSVVGGIFLDIDDIGGIIVENEHGLHRLQQGSLR
jgi:hypothetical protein